MESNISPLLAALREQDKDGEKEEDRKLFRDKKGHNVTYIQNKKQISIQECGQSLIYL